MDNIERGKPGLPVAGWAVLAFGVVLLFLVAVIAITLSVVDDSSGDARADILCEQLDENQMTSPDQIARRIYGNGQFAVAAAGIRSACVADHGAVAVYFDDTASYDYGDPIPQVPLGYGTSPY